MSATCPTPEQLALSAAQDKAAKTLEALHARLSYLSGGDLESLLDAAAPKMDAQEVDECRRFIVNLAGGLATAEEALGDSRRALRNIEDRGSAASREAWASAYRELKRCRTQVVKLQAAVAEVREYLEPLARNAGAAISIVAEWPMEEA